MDERRCLLVDDVYKHRVRVTSGGWSTNEELKEELLTLHKQCVHCKLWNLEPQVSYLEDALAHQKADIDQLKRDAKNATTCAIL